MAATIVEAEFLNCESYFESSVGVVLGCEGKKKEVSEYLYRIVFHQRLPVGTREVGDVLAQGRSLHLGHGRYRR